MKLKRLDEILSQAAGKRIVVIGDLMLDEFVWGKVGRISPEAPVPVVQVTGESFFPGGAANVARNLREFVDRTAVIGVVGRDRGGRQLRTLLDEQNIDTAAIVEDPDLQTIVKTRVIAGHQQVVRVDREQVRGPTAEQIANVTTAFGKIVADIDAVIFEDYGKGFLGSELVRQISAQAQAAGKIVAADPNPNHPLNWRNTTVVKPNRAEAFLAAGSPCTDSADHPEKDEALMKVGATLLGKWDTKLLLVTLGEQGMMLFQKNEAPHHIPTKAQQVFDVSGAGDTAIALFTLALCCDASPIEAAEIANHASAVVVGKLGTATVTKQELRASFKMTRAPLELRKPAVFLDRDGTIMRDVDFCSDPEAVEIFEGAGDALQRLKKAGFKLFVITNQSGIGRGYFSETEYRAVEKEVERKLGPDLIDATYFCPDKPGDESRRRKPSPEMVLEAAREHNVDLSRSFFVGDKAIDVECGRNAGMRTILVRTGYAETNRCKPTWTAENLAAVAEIILREAK